MTIIISTVNGSHYVARPRHGGAPADHGPGGRLVGDFEAPYDWDLMMFGDIYVMSSVTNYDM